MRPVVPDQSISRYSQEYVLKRRIGMRCIGIITALVILAALVLPALNRPVAAQTNGALVRTDFQVLEQGNVGLMRVSGRTISDVRAVFQERIFYFYQDDNDWVSLLSADMNSTVGPQTVQLWVQYEDGTSEQIDKDIQINYGNFGRSEINVPVSVMPLLEPAVEQAEMERLDNLFERFTPERYWKGGFEQPDPSPLVGFFGTFRLFNGTYQRRHTGVDMIVPVGTPVKAAASGRVILAQMLDIRGNYILIDHGWGVYSGYAHNSQMFVVPGQWVDKSDVIAFSGNTGRATGAHIHFEMALGGVWINPEQFLGLGLTLGTEQTAG